MSRRELIVSASEAGLSLSEYVARMLVIDPRAAADLIAGGAVFLSGKRARRADEKVKEGARIVVHAAEPSPESEVELRVLHEDDDIIVLDKAPGDHLNETETSSRRAIVELLRGRIPEIRVVHRLDRETSGVVLLAKNAAEAERLSAAFRERRVEKVYLALCEGSIGDRELDDPIAIDRRRPRARRVASSGQAARTVVRTISRSEGLSAIEARPITGRTHQIRVHLAHHGAPILGDRLYGGPFAVRLGGKVQEIDRVLLHARRLTVPLRSGIRTFSAAIPEDMACFRAHGLALEDGSA